MDEPVSIELGYLSCILKTNKTLISGKISKQLVLFSLIIIANYIERKISIIDHDFARQPHFKIRPCPQSRTKIYLPVILKLITLN
jgi:hypothetical protein